MSSSFNGSGGAVHGARSDEILGSAEEALAYIKTIPPRQGASMQGVPFEKHDGVVRVGAIGVGGSSVLAREEDGQPLLPLDEAEFLEYGH